MIKGLAATAAHEVDLRSLAPAQRHKKVFQLARQLPVGTSFVLLTDHDPKAIHYELQAEHRHQFFWNYLGEGPEQWRVHIGRLQAAG